MSKTRRARDDPWREERAERIARRVMRKRKRERRRRDRRARKEASWQGHGSCGRKARFATRQEAETWAAGNRARYGGLTSEQWPYECPFCGGWHLTSHPWNASRRE